MKNLIKKNQLAILIIALMLVTAGYLNYTSNNTEEEAVYTSALDNSLNVQTNIGDAMFVNSDSIEEDNIIETQNNTGVQENTTEEDVVETSSKTNINSNEYFVNSKLQRDTMYSQMIEAYEKLLENNSISEAQKTIATEEITKINNTKNAIMISENLIKTKGFEECVIFVNDQSISIIVKGEELKTEEIAQIQNIVSREIKADIENIHISNKI